MSQAASPLHAPPPSRAGSLDLVGGELALDFTNTSSGRGSPTHQEHLRDIEDLLRWAEHARVMTGEDCDYARSEIARAPGLGVTIFKRALPLREWISRIATSMAERAPVPPDLTLALTKAHSDCLVHADLVRRGDGFMWAWDPRRDLASAMLGPITLSALSLLMEKDLLRTKRCQGVDCGWFFFDATKNGRRRWCEMKVCGNRAKARASRKRRKALA